MNHFKSVREINAACRRLQCSQRQVLLILPSGEARRVLRAKTRKGRLLVFLLTPALNAWVPCTFADLIES